MNIFKKAWCRIYQKVTFVAMAFMPWRIPQVISGENCFENTAELLSKKQVTRPLIVCDKSALDRHALDGFFQAAKGVLQYVVYDEVLPNPTVKQVKRGAEIYRENNCNGILAFGGGSVMDCAKGIGALIVRPDKSVNQLKGLLKVRKKLPTFVAVPTTAGTGSECTVAAVITDAETRDKYAINDFSLIPHFAVLDPVLTQALPPFLTATTGMDALTHAVEAYIGHSNTKKTKAQAEEAVKLVFENLETATRNGNNLTARANMQRAAYLAGLAFTRAYVGSVHALAHSLGGYYGIAHGLANAVLLPVVLKKYGKRVYKKLARLAAVIGVVQNNDSAEEASKNFIDAIFDLNKRLNIPENFGGKIKPQDIPELAKHAEKETNPLYPVPQLWTSKQFEEVFEQVM